MLLLFFNHVIADFTLSCLIFILCRLRAGRCRNGGTGARICIGRLDRLLADYIYRALLGYCAVGCKRAIDNNRTAINCRKRTLLSYCAAIYGYRRRGCCR